MKIYNIYVKIPKDYIEEDYMSDENPLLHKYTYYLNDIDKIYQLKNNRYYTGLYAWTTSKKLLKAFLKDRINSIYTIVKESIDEYGFITKYYKAHQLKEREYFFIDNDGSWGKMDIVTTKFEHDVASDPYSAYAFIFTPLIHYNYRIFNSDIIDALDILGYTKFYDRTFNDNDVDLMEYLDYNESYGCTSLGHHDYFTFNNQVNSLVFLFDYFFTGVNVNDNRRKNS